MPAEVFVGRQPIFDGQNNIYGYEVLFRSSEANVARISNESMATSQVLVTTLIDMDVERILHDKIGFVNLGRNFLVDGLAHALPPEKVVIEVLEDIEPDQEVCDALSKLRDGGYSIALDDYVGAPNQVALLDWADIVKVDVPGVGTADLEGVMIALRGHNVRLLAEKVETQAEYRALKAMGFDYFQGYYLAKPEVIRGRRIAAKKMDSIRLLAQLSDANVTFSELADSITRDAGLSFRMLRLLNSPFYGMRHKVESIHECLVMLGLDQVRRWVSMVVMASMSDKPPALVTLGLVRAKVAEGLAAATGKVDERKAFTVGLFSILDAMVDRPLAEVLQSAPLADDLTAALLDRFGPLGNILTAVLAHERGEWASIDDLGVDAQTLNRIYFEAVEWAEQSHGV